MRSDYSEYTTGTLNRVCVTISGLVLIGIGFWSLFAR